MDSQILTSDQQSQFGKLKHELNDVGRAIRFLGFVILALRLFVIIPSFAVIGLVFGQHGKLLLAMLALAAPILLPALIIGIGSAWLLFMLGTRIKTLYDRQTGFYLKIVLVIAIILFLSSLANIGYDTLLYAVFLYYPIIGLVIWKKLQATPEVSIDLLDMHYHFGRKSIITLCSLVVLSVVFVVLLSFGFIF